MLRVLMDTEFQSKGYTDQMKYIELKAKSLFEKIEVLQENKDLISKERLFLEER